MITAKEANEIVESSRKQALDKLFKLADTAVREACLGEHCATVITEKNITDGAVAEFMKTIAGEPWKIDSAVEFSSRSGGSPLNVLDEVRIKLFW